MPGGGPYWLGDGPCCEKFSRRTQPSQSGHLLKAWRRSILALQKDKSINNWVKSSGTANLLETGGRSIHAWRRAILAGRRALLKDCSNNMISAVSNTNLLGRSILALWGSHGRTAKVAGLGACNIA